MKRLLMFVLAGMLLLSACGGADDIEVKNPWARTAMKGENSAVYFDIHNGLNEADELLGVSSDVAASVEVHLSLITADGVMQMTKQDSVALDAGAEVTFAPGGLHIMLVGLTRDLKAGDQFQLTLHFKSHADIVLTVTVQEMEGMNGHMP